MAKRTAANSDKLTAPPLKPVAKRIGRVRGGGKTAEELGIEVEGLDYGDSPVPPPKPDEHNFERDRTPPHMQGKTIFPAPDSFKMGWDKFRRYLQMLFDSDQYRPRTRLHGYRTWPVLLEGKRKVFRMDGVLDDEVSGDAIPLKVLSIQDVLHMCGSGSYHFKVHDIGAANKNICMCNLERAELRDSDYPPILNIDDLDPDDPLNATFLKSIKQRRSQGEEITEGQMAGEILEVAKLVMAQQDKDKGGDAGTVAAMDVMSHAAKQSMDMVLQAAKRPDAPASPQINPMELVTSVLGVVKELSGGGGNDKYMEALRLAQESERAMFAAQMDFMKEQMAQMRESQQSAATAAQNAPPPKPEGAASHGMIGQMRDLVEMKELARELVGRGGGSGNSWADLAPVAVQAAQPLIQGLSMWLASQAAGGPVAAPQAGQAGQAGQPGQQQPQQGAAVPGVNPELVQALEQLRAPLLRIFHDSNRNGADFADFFVDLAGEDAYRQLTGIGPDQLQALLMSYPPLAQELGDKEDKLKTFILEFMDAFNEQQTPPQPDEAAEESSEPPVMMPPPAMGFGAYGFSPQPEPEPQPEEAPSPQPVEEPPVETLDAEPVDETPPTPEDHPKGTLRNPIREEDAKPAKKKAARKTVKARKTA